MPVCSTRGVGYPWQVQPFTVRGAPPPLPFRSPRLTIAAKSFSMPSAVAQDTDPLVTLTMTGTLAPVRVVPQASPEGVA